MNPLVNISNGKATTTSIKVAETFEKQHKNVLQDISNMLNNLTAEFSATNFQQSTYINRGKEYPMYLLTKDGFTMLAFGYNGKKAMHFKEEYIQQFNHMEQTIKDISNQNQIPSDLENRIQALEQRTVSPVQNTSNDALINLLQSIVGYIAPTGLAQQPKQFDNNTSNIVENHNDNTYEFSSFDYLPKSVMDYLSALESALNSYDYSLYNAITQRFDTFVIGCVLGKYDKEFLYINTIIMYELYKNSSNNCAKKSFIHSELAKNRIAKRKNKKGVSASAFIQGKRTNVVKLYKKQLSKYIDIERYKNV